MTSTWAETTAQLDRLRRRRGAWRVRIAKVHRDLDRYNRGRWAAYAIHPYLSFQLPIGRFHSQAEALERGRAWLAGTAHPAPKTWEGDYA